MIFWSLTMSSFFFIFAANSLFPFIILDSLFLDSLGLNLSQMMIWVSLMVLNCSVSSMKKMKSFFSAMLISINIFCVLFFCATNLISLFFFFEMSVIPMITLILVLGLQPERLAASIYLLFYTMSMGIPLFLSIMFFKKKIFGGQMMPNVSVSGEMMILHSSQNLINLTSIFFLIISVSFLTKIPVFFFHMWLPKAHLEASFSGSILLASIYLKMGVLGLSRIISISSNCLKVFNFLNSVFLGGALILSILMIFQIDMKRIIALASVVHMSMCVFVLLTSITSADKISSILSIGHSMSASALFYLNSILYTISNSRSMILTKSLNLSSPFFFSMIFFALITNFAFPFTLSLMSEAMIFFISSSWSYVFFIIGLFLGFMNMMTSLYIFWGPMKKNFFGWSICKNLMSAPTNILMLLIPQVCLFLSLNIFF